MLKYLKLAIFIAVNPEQSDISRVKFGRENDTKIHKYFSALSIVNHERDQASAESPCECQSTAFIETQFVSLVKC